MTEWSTRREFENQPAPEEANEDELCLSGESMARFSDFVELKPFKFQWTNTVVFALSSGISLFLKLNVKGVYVSPIRDDGFKPYLTSNFLSQIFNSL